MILEQETFDKFNYSVIDLTKASNKKIVLKCDYCHEVYESTMKVVNKGREVISKDSCKSCRFKKREDISLVKYGVKNSAQRDDVRKKISDGYRSGDDDVKEKIRQTNLQRYGVESAMQNEEIRLKHQKSIIEKYGVENISQLDEVKERREQTNTKTLAISTQF